MLYLPPSSAPPAVPPPGPPTFSQLRSITEQRWLCWDQIACGEQTLSALFCPFPHPILFYFEVWCHPGLPVKFPACVIGLPSLMCSTCVSLPPSTFFSSCALLPVCSRLSCECSGVLGSLNVLCESLNSGIFVLLPHYLTPPVTQYFRMRWSCDIGHVMHLSWDI